MKKRLKKHWKKKVNQKDICPIASLSSFMMFPYSRPDPDILTNRSQISKQNMASTIPSYPRIGRLPGTAQRHPSFGLAVPTLSWVPFGWLQASKSIRLKSFPVVAIHNPTYAHPLCRPAQNPSSLCAQPHQPPSGWLGLPMGFRRRWFCRFGVCSLFVVWLCRSPCSMRSAPAKPPRHPLERRMMDSRVARAGG